MDPRQILRKSPSVRFRVVAGEGVVIQQKSAEVLVVNEVGARILSLVDGERSAASIASAVAQEFDADRDMVARDLDGYLDELLAVGVVEEVPGSR